MKQRIIKNFKKLAILLIFAALINIAAAGIIEQNNETNIKSTTSRSGLLLIPDSTDDTVGMYDPYDGTYLGVLINGAGLFSTPINAVLGPDGNIYVSDQVADSIFVYDNTGTYLYTYADASDGLNNIRGFDFRGGHLFVTSGDDYVAEFDGPHNRLPDFINDGTDPFDILFLTDNTSILNDILGDDILLYDENGIQLQTIFSVDFPEQTQFDSVSPGAFLTASFSANVITDFDLNGVITETTPFSGGRGVYRLGNGNLLATNGNGIHEIQPGTGTIIETKKTGSGRFIEYFGSDINFPPYQPSDPYPSDGAVDVELDADLSWTGGDPDGDPVTYDVYFDTVTPPALVVSNQSETSYDPGTLEFETKYYWQIGAWDDQGAYTAGPIWSFTTIEAPKIPDLDCSGTLEWDEVEPGATVEGSIDVINIGDPESLLNWEIESYPDWGNWTFDPESGTDLTPEAGAFSISVSVVAPNEEETEFTGEIVLVNSDDSSDTCTISVTLATPYCHPTLFIQIMNWIFERFPVLKLIFG